MWKKALIPLSVFMVTMMACCVTTPTGRKQLMLVPSSQMHQLGEQAYEEMKQKETISRDRALTATVVNIGRQIAAASGLNYDWEFTLFDSEQVNAFCLPGGKVGIYTGLLPVAKTNAALAAVLGHEVAHAAARHGAERVSQALVVNGVLIGADVAMRDSQYRGVVLAGLGLGAQVGVLLPFSRSHEMEADQIGLRYMAQAGFDPREAVNLWKRMGEAGGAAPPEFISTHPNPRTRVRSLSSQLDEVLPLYESSEKIPTRKLI